MQSASVLLHSKWTIWCVCVCFHNFSTCCHRGLTGRREIGRRVDHKLKKRQRAVAELALGLAPGALPVPAGRVRRREDEDARLTQVQKYRRSMTFITSSWAPLAPFRKSVLYRKRVLLLDEHHIYYIYIHMCTYFLRVPGGPWFFFLYSTVCVSRDTHCNLVQFVGVPREFRLANGRSHARFCLVRAYRPMGHLGRWHVACPIVCSRRKGGPNSMSHLAGSTQSVCA